MKNSDIINELKSNQIISDEYLLRLIESDDNSDSLYQTADEVRQTVYGKDVYIRGLIEFTNYCKNNCYYCGIRFGNKSAQRYRLDKEDILSCCDEGWRLGFRTFVLQGGEDMYFTDSRMCDIVYSIRQKYPDCAITLSLGEKSKQSYIDLFSAGANRYLLRHETANEAHYSKLHPQNMSLKNRKECLFNLKEIGYQVGSGFMVGSPFQTADNILEDLKFLKELDPDMIGIGPFIKHEQTPFSSYSNGTLAQTLRLISILRLMFPYALIPATTALGTIHPDGREMGIKAGANVVMPNLSPLKVREKYTLYDNKICTGDESALCVASLSQSIKAIGYDVVISKGDVKRT